MSKNIKEGKMDCYWSSVSSLWCEQNIKRESKPFRVARRNEFADFITKTLFRYKNPNIVELGTNYAENLKVIQQKMSNANLYGMDIGADAIQEAQKRVEGVEFEVASILNMPYKKDQFDLVFTMGVLMHLHPDDIDAAIKNIVKISKNYIVHCEAATPEYHAKIKNTLSNKNTEKYGPRRQYIFQHDFKELYKSNKKVKLVKEFDLECGLTVFLFKKK